MARLGFRGVEVQLQPSPRFGWQLRALHIYACLRMLTRMRTTLDINDRLLAEAKSHAAQRGLSLKALVEEALRERLHARKGPRASVGLPTFSGDGLQPGVDLTDGAALLEIMDADPGR
jgi:hypothetical protein